MGEHLTGHCLCGAVSFALPVESAPVGVCHCGMCRRWTGGPMMAISHAYAIEFAGKEHIATYASSDVVERAFCKLCGSALYTRMRGQDQYFLAAGAIDQQDALTLQEEIFIDCKPGYYEFAGDRPRLTEAEFLAHWQDQASKD